MSSALGFAAFCLATGDLGGGEWEQTGHIWGLPRDSEAPGRSTPPWSIQNHSPNRTMATLQPPPAVLLAQEPPTPRAPSRRAPHTSARPTISSLSAPVSSSAHSWGRRERKGSGADTGKDKGGVGLVNGVKEVATVLGEGQGGGPKTWTESGLSVSGANG